MENFVEKVNGLQPLIIVVKLSILDVFSRPRYAPVHLSIIDTNLSLTGKTPYNAGENFKVNMVYKLFSSPFSSVNTNFCLV